MAVVQTLTDLYSFAAFASLLTVLVAYLITSSYTNHRKLKSFDGPLLAKFSGSWMFFKTLNKQLYQAEKEAIKNYGAPARIAPNLLVTNDPDVIHHINRPGSAWTRSTWYEAMKLDPRIDTVFSTRSEKLHAELRSKEAGGYQGRGATTMESDIDEQIHGLIHLINSYQDKPMDFAKIAKYFTLDVLSTVAFGRSFGFMAANADLWEFNKGGEAFAPVLELMSNHTWVRNVLNTPFMQSLAAPRPTDKTGVGPSLAFAHRAVAERMSGQYAERTDILNYFKSKGLSQTQLEAEAHLQILAGSDSTTTIIRSVLFTLVGMPMAYLKLRQEIDESIAAGRISRPVVTFAEAQKLPYLSACISEGIRMFPPLFGLKTKLAPSGGETIKGIYYPEGTELGLCDEAMQRREDIFGADAQLYRPDRWLNADVETRKKFTRTVDMVFGAGRFVCLGKHIAMMELHKALVELLRRYDWAMADPMRGIDCTSQGSHAQSNMNLLATPRHLAD